MAWTLYELKALRKLENPVSENGIIHLLPSFKGERSYGTKLAWEAKLYRKDTQELLPVNQETLQKAGLSAADAARWQAKAQEAAKTLDRLYPVFSADIADRVKALEDAVPVAHA